MSSSNYSRLAERILSTTSNPPKSGIYLRGRFGQLHPKAKENLLAAQSYMSVDELLDVVERLPRARLAHLPTPLESCPRLARELSPSGGGPAVYVKREDLTGPGLGGNKMRHLEFRIGDALAQGCDTFIYVDDANAARSTAAACAKAGMRYIQVVPSQEPSAPTANLALSRILGAEIHYAPVTGRLRTEAHEMAATIEDRLRGEGRKPYRLQAMPWFDLSGVVSYLLAGVELKRQLEQEGIEEAHFFMVTGHSHAGLQLAAKILGLSWAVTGVGVAQVFEPEYPMSEWSRQVAEMLELPTSLTPDEVLTDYGHSAPGYHLPSTESVAAVEIAGRTEGLILDPAYTGKAMAALIDHMRSGALDPDSTVIFIHTGGIPMLFDNLDLFT